MKKYSKNYIYYHLVVDFILIFFILLCFFTEIISAEETLLKEQLIFTAIVFLISLVIIYILKTVYSILYYKTSGYELKNDKIECVRGVFFRKKSILEYKKIHAVNKKQNLFHRLFKIAVLTLDSGSANTGSTAEILIIEKDNEIDKLLEEIKLKQSGNIESEEIESIKVEKENLYEFTAKSKLWYSLINGITTLVILVCLSAIVAVIFSFALPLLNNVNLGGIGEILVIALYVVLGYLGVSIFVFIISVLVSFLNYYNFSVYKNENDIEINYGFFVHNKNTFKLNKIKGVVISQNLIQKLFKFVSVKLEVIGYNEASNNENNNQTTGVLFPLCKESEVEENIKSVLPNYLPDKIEIKAKRYFPFVSWNLFFIGVFSALIIGITVLELAVFKVLPKTILTTFVIMFLGALINCSFVLIDGVLEYLNNGISVNNDKLTITNGAFTKKTIVIYRKHVIGIEDVTTPLRKKAGIYSFKIHFRANDQTNVITLKNVDESVKETLRNVVKY